MSREERVRATELLRSADAVVIAASNGFDIADGYNQFSCDREYVRVFGDLRQRYGVGSILMGLVATWPNDACRWKFLARLITYGYRDYEPSPVMRALDRLTADVPRFVVTCNCNGRFERAGFSPDALLETEGSYARLRCTGGCTEETFDALPYLGSKKPPRCPRCGAPLDVAVDDTGQIARLEPFRAQTANLHAFLAEHEAERVCVLELGMGQRNRAIKAPLMAWAEAAPRASYVVVNREEPVLPSLPPERVAAVHGDLREVLLALDGEAV